MWCASKIREPRFSGIKFLLHLDVIVTIFSDRFRRIGMRADGWQEGSDPARDSSETVPQALFTRDILIFKVTTSRNLSRKLYNYWKMSRDYVKASAKI